MTVIRFVDRGIRVPTSYEVTPMTGILKYTLKRNLPSSAYRNTFIYTTDTQELYHGAGAAAPLKVVYSNEEAKRTVVFYVGIIQDPDQEMSIYVPFKGDITKVYVNLGKASERDLDINLSLPSRDVKLADLKIESGEQFLEMPLEGLIDKEPLKMIVDGEISLSDISVLVDIIPHRN